jgi:hypothetical protein
MPCLIRLTRNTQVMAYKPVVGRFSLQGFRGGGTEFSYRWSEDWILQRWLRNLTLSRTPVRQILQLFVIPSSDIQCLERFARLEVRRQRQAHSFGPPHFILS